ncbi:MAG: thiol reductant ABC exporter subunit CydC, partial [Acetobacteraceae bacterium]|nr:thiol reductant ABC exporter subunit CydC [Acetobacteraceae bacterium]
MTAGILWRDLARVIGLWRPRAGRLLLGVAAAAGSALLGALLLVLAGGGMAAALDGQALGGASLGAAAGAGFLLLRPLVLLRPAARWAERMVSHAATFRALADTRVWFFRRLAERLPGGLGLNRSGDLWGRIVADVESLDGLYLRALVPGAVALLMVLVVAALLGAAPVLALVVALPLVAALLLPLLLAPGAARAAEAAATAQGGVRAAAVDPFLGLEDTLAANAEGRAATQLAGEA